MNLWKRLFGGGSKPPRTTTPKLPASAPKRSPEQTLSTGGGCAVLSGSAETMGPFSRAGMIFEMPRYDGGSVEGFYERMSKALIAKHGPLVSVDYKSHFLKFEIWFCYQDGMRVYSGERTEGYDIHFLTLGYYGEGLRYAQHFLAAAGFDFNVEEIESIRPGDSLVMKGGKAAIMRKKEKVVGGGEVTFLREETRPIEGKSATYRYYKAPSKAAALAFLNQQNIFEQMFYVVVESLDGRWVKDWMGTFDA